jgi:hypothetical protein
MAGGEGNGGGPEGGFLGGRRLGGENLLEMSIQSPLDSILDQLSPDLMGVLRALRGGATPQMPLALTLINGIGDMYVNRLQSLDDVEVLWQEFFAIFHELKGSLPIVRSHVEVSGSIDDDDDPTDTSGGQPLARFPEQGPSLAIKFDPYDMAFKAFGQRFSAKMALLQRQEEDLERERIIVHDQYRRRGRQRFGLAVLLGLSAAGAGYQYQDQLETWGSEACEQLGLNEDLSNPDLNPRIVPKD